MKRKTLSGAMLTLLLVNVMYFAALNPIATVASSDIGSLDYGVFSETIDWWWMFRHDLNHTGYSNSTVPTPLYKCWDTGDIIHGSVKSSPAVVDGKVFVGSENGKVYALNEATGKEIWNYTTGGTVQSSPAVAAGVVFVGSDDFRVYALNKTTGKQIWNYTTGREVRPSPAISNGMVFFGSLDGYVYALNATTISLSPEKRLIWKYWAACPVYSSPAVSGGRVFIGARDGRVYALNVTGRYEWHFDTWQNCSSSPAVVDGKVFVGSENGKVYALNEATGKEIWNYTTGAAVKSSPAVVDDRVFIGSMDHNVYALNASTGKILWSFTTNGFVYSSPAVADGKVFVGSGDNKTYVLNAVDGSLVWNFTTGGSIYSSPAVANKMVFIGSDDKKVYAIGPENKAPQPIIHHYPEQPSILQKVTFDGSASFDPDGSIKNCTWDFGDGFKEINKPWNPSNQIRTHAYGAIGSYTVTLTVTDSDPNNPRKNSTSHIVTVQEAWPMYRHDWSHTGCSTFFGPVTNRTLWNPLRIGPDASADSYMYSSPAVIDGIVYIGSTNGTVFAINATTGKDIWHKTPGGSIHSSPAVADGLVFIGSDDTKVYALNATNGEIRWSCAMKGKVYSSPTVWNGSVYVTSEEGRIYSMNEFVPLGSYTWEPSSPIYKGEWRADSYVYTSPAVAYGMVFFGSDDKYVYARDAQAVGGVKWLYKTNGSVRSSPCVAGGMVFVGSDDGYLYAFNATSAPLSLEKRLIWKFKTNGNIASSPCVAGGMVFVGSDDGHLYAVNIATGKQVWNKTIGQAGWSSPIIADCKVFIGSKDGTIYAFHKDDGDLVWSYQTYGPIDSSAAVFNDTLYVVSKKDVASQKGTLYAFSGDQIHDVAITGVTASPSIVVQNGTINISVAVENQGTYNETNITVIAYYFNATHSRTEANRTVINSLSRHGKVIETILWSTRNVAEGNYTISANATLATDQYPTDNYYEDGNVTIGKVRNINVTDVWVGYNQTGPVHYAKTVVAQGYNATICVTVKNEGEMEETNITVTAYWSNGTYAHQIIGNYTIDRLPANTSKTITIRWNTNVTGVPFGAPLAKGNYTISAYASPVSGENASDNYKENGKVYVGIPGDVNGDGKVDLKDVYAVQKAYSSSINTTDGQYWHQPPRVCCPHSPNCDINNDGKIDLKDYYITTKNYGKVDP